MSLRVLLATLDDAFCDRVTPALETSGLVVERARDSHEVIAALSASQPAFLVLDWLFRPLDGIDLLKAVRSDPTTDKLPVAMLFGRSANVAAPKLGVSRSGEIWCFENFEFAITRDWVKDGNEIAQAIREVLASRYATVRASPDD